MFSPSLLVWIPMAEAREDEREAEEARDERSSPFITPWEHH